MSEISTLHANTGTFEAAAYWEKKISVCMCTEANTLLCCISQRNEWPQWGRGRSDAWPRGRQAQLWIGRRKEAGYQEFVWCVHANNYFPGI